MLIEHLSVNSPFNGKQRTIECSWLWFADKCHCCMEIVSCIKDHSPFTSHVMKFSRGLCGFGVPDSSENRGMVINIIWRLSSFAHKSIKYSQTFHWTRHSLTFRLGFLIGTQNVFLLLPLMIPTIRWMNVRAGAQHTQTHTKDHIKTKLCYFTWDVITYVIHSMNQRIHARRERKRVNTKKLELYSQVDTHRSIKPTMWAIFFLCFGIFLFRLFHSLMAMSYNDSVQYHIWINGVESPTWNTVWTLNRTTERIWRY